ncbi:pectinesterase inhibitor 10-like protein [Tanacetum coccineum]
MVKLAEVHGMSLLEIYAMKDCIELLGDSVYELKQSLDEMNHPGSKDSGLVMSYIQTWFSSAMTDEETCSEGFADDPKMKGVLVEGIQLELWKLEGGAVFHDMSSLSAFEALVSLVSVLFNEKKCHVGVFCRLATFPQRHMSLGKNAPGTGAFVVVRIIFAD